jgi:hypothetical protein
VPMDCAKPAGATSIASVVNARNGNAKEHPRDLIPRVP